MAIVIMHGSKREDRANDPRNVCTCVTKLSLNNASVYRKYVESIPTQTCRACEVCNHQSK